MDASVILIGLGMKFAEMFVSVYLLCGLTNAY
jgi:hypothetical protein